MLKIRLTIIVLLVSRFISVAQVSENFDDGNFTTNPIWTGDISSFEVLSGQLHSIDSTVNSTYYLSTASAVANNAQWEIYLNLKFSTSSANYADVFLISDKPDVNNASNGYFVRIGGTPDEISLYRNDAGTAVKIIDGVDGRSQISSDNRIKITVTRSASNVFTLIDSVAAASPVILTEGTATDANYAVSLYFGISVKQSTASFFGKHYFDNIYCGNIVTDTIPPVLSNCIVVNQNAVDLLFSEPLEINSAQSLLNYSVDNGIGNPASVTLDGGNAALVHLTFANAFTNGLQNTITVNNVLDVSLNTIGTNTTSTFTYNAAAAVQPLDVVFSEIMADPSTGSSLPPQEYVEIYNRSNKSFDIQNWSFTDATGSHQTFPQMTLLPNEFAVICDNAYQTSFAQFGKVIAVNTMPALNNDGDNLSLFDAGNNLIDQVSYDKSFYHDVSKENGGWSIEKIDLNFPCGSADNWKASQSVSGGTPASLNSVNGILSDTTLPYITSVIIIDSLTIEIKFSELMNAASLNNNNYYFINNGIGAPASVTVGSSSQSVILTLPVNLQPQTIYTLTVGAAISDCSGNAIDSVQNNFGLPETALTSDVLINEILFNPFPGGYDFVELYNRSSKIIDLAQLNITELDATTGLPSGSSVPLSTEGYYLLPGKYVALTLRRDDIISRYNSPFQSGILNVSGFPDFNNDENICLITNELGNTVDEFRYSEKFQYPLLNNPEGYSLERISFNRSTQDSSNWHSAATSVLATPAYKNSQSEDDVISDNAITINPETFSPDDDGYNDVLNINLNFNEPGLSATVQVYDNRGRLIQNLLRNQLIGSESNISWDGINLDNQKASIGIYILYTETFNENGDVKKYKNVFVLAGKLK